MQTVTSGGMTLLCLKKKYSNFQILAVMKSHKLPNNLFFWCFHIKQKYTNLISYEILIVHTNINLSFQFVFFKVCLRLT